MIPSPDEFVRELRDRPLPGGTIVVESHEARIADQALRSTTPDGDAAHPVWFVIASLRAMGVTVDELCALAHMEDGDTLLMGTCTIDQERPLRIGGSYEAGAGIGEVSSRTTRDGARLDRVDVVVDLAGDEGRVGAVTSTYLFKRRAA